MSKSRIHTRISGRVQGVGYRYSAYNQAIKLGIKGWVKNTYNGDVEAIFEGDNSVVDEMIAWCRIGPPMATVTNVEILITTYTGEFHDFNITR
jgi:acylphosphatase